ALGTESITRPALSVSPCAIADDVPRTMLTSTPGIGTVALSVTRMAMATVCAWPASAAGEISASVARNRVSTPRRYIGGRGPTSGACCDGAGCGPSNVYADLSLRRFRPVRCGGTDLRIDLDAVSRIVRRAQRLRS